MATVLGTGKLREAAWTGGSGVVEPYRKKSLAEDEGDEADAPPELDEEGVSLLLLMGVAMPLRAAAGG